MPEPTSKWFGGKPATIQHTEPSEPPKALQVDEVMERLESALIHPFETLKDMHRLLACQDEKLEKLIQDNLIKRQFRDEPISIGLTVSYTLKYYRHIFVYMYSNTAFTLLVSNGASQVIPANYWTNVSYPEGSYFSVSGGSDTVLQNCLVRAIDFPLEMATAQIAGTVTAVIPENTSNTATISSVAGANSDTLLLAANTSRKGASIFNDSTATLYLSQGTVAASLTSYTTQVLPNALYEVFPTAYRGMIRGIWSASAGNARITENT